jgi:hypothetical protein
MAGNEDLARDLKRTAIAALEQITDPADRDLIKSQIAEEPWFGVL